LAELEVEYAKGLAVYEETLAMTEDQVPSLFLFFLLYYSRAQS